MCVVLLDCSLYEFSQPFVIRARDGRTQPCFRRRLVRCRYRQGYNGCDDDRERRCLGTIPHIPLKSCLILTFCQDPPEEVVKNCTKEVDEVVRWVEMCSIPTNPISDFGSSVLRKNGLFLYLTFGQPHFRRRYLQRPGTDLEIRQLGEAFHYYLYVVRV